MARGQLLDASVTIGSTQVTLLAADPNRSFLYIANGHASQTLGVNLFGTTAQIGGLTTTTLAGGGTMLMDFGVPSNAITAIASGASTPVVVHYMDSAKEAL